MSRFKLHCVVLMKRARCSLGAIINIEHWKSLHLASTWQKRDEWSFWHQKFIALLKRFIKKKTVFTDCVKTVLSRVNIVKKNNYDFFWRGGESIVFIIIVFSSIWTVNELLCSLCDIINWGRCPKLIKKKKWSFHSIPILTWLDFHWFFSPPPLVFFPGKLPNLLVIPRGGISFSQQTGSSTSSQL